ncbi:MAG: uroporphyrinogen-III synthase, partial [Candidatus Latescibacteria bacterium]|nr:uroporphyrinogen-III synthase [Candidatus Latescibacterota bacterium]
EKYIAEGLVDALFADGSVKGLPFLLVSSDIGRKTLSEELERAGASVTKTVFYSTQPAILSQHIKTVVKNGKIDMVTFTSSSTALNFFDQIPPGEFDSRIKIASIGPQTSETLKRLNREPDIEALVFTTDGLASTILEYCGKKQ